MSNIVPTFDLRAFMSTADLPIYGQVFAYGLGLAGIGFGLRQIVSAIGLLVAIFRKK